ncbi:MAG: nitroreductase family protein [Dehalococcoidia bacterium]
MAQVLNLTPDELLTTTRSVRKRLDLDHPVEREVLEDCLRIAQQAPTASNRQNWHFVVVTEQATRDKLAELYRRGGETYRGTSASAMAVTYDDPERQAAQDSVTESATWLIENIHKVPVYVIPCFNGRTDSAPAIAQGATWGTIGPATWNFQLALRSRGLGSVWTSFHLFHEEEAAKILGIPYAEVQQAALLPVAYTKGTEFKRGHREPLEKMVHWETW